MFPGCVFNAKALVQWSYKVYAGRFLQTGHIGLIVVFKTCLHQLSEGGAVAVRYLAPSSHITHQGNIAEVLERCQHNFCSHYSFFGGKFVHKYSVLLVLFM